MLHFLNLQRPELVRPFGSSPSYLHVSVCSWFDDIQIYLIMLLWELGIHIGGQVVNPSDVMSRTLCLYFPYLCWTGVVGTSRWLVPENICKHIVFLGIPRLQSKTPILPLLSLSWRILRHIPMVFIFSMSSPDLNSWSYPVTHASVTLNIITLFSQRSRSLSMWNVFSASRWPCSRLCKLLSTVSPPYW